MRILFTNTAFQDSVEYTSLISVVPPLDLAYCAALVRRELGGVVPSIIDANVEALGPEAIARRVGEVRPEILVITAETHSQNRVRRLLDALGADRPMTVLVGTHGSALPERTLAEQPGLDVVVRGEPEWTVLELVRARMDGGPLGDVAGIHYRQGDQIHSTPERPFHPRPDQLPFPARDLLKNDRYSSPFATGVTALRTTRGCPGRCTFCDSHVLYGQRIRTRTPQSVVDEMQDCIHRYGTRYFAILDHTFTAHRSFVVGLCDLIVRRNLGVRWVCNTRVDMLDDEILARMRAAGCLQVGIGMESAVNEGLEAVGKGIDEDQLYQAIRRIKRHGIVAMGYAIVGFPEDGPETIEATRRKIFELNPHTLQLSFAAPLPGSRLYERCLREGRILSDDWGDYVFLRKSIIRNDHMSPEELAQRRQAILRDFYLRPGKLAELAGFLTLRARVHLPSAGRAAAKILRRLARP